MATMELTFLGEDYFNDDFNPAADGLHHDNAQQQEKVEDFVTIILISACEHISAKNFASGHLLLLLKKARPTILTTLGDVQSSRLVIFDRKNRLRMAREPDEELRKAFSQLHEKMIDTTQKLKLADLQIEKLKRSKNFAELTMKEITSYPKDTKTYESVGRMFLLDDMDSIKAGLDKRMKNADEKVKTLENNKTYLQQNLKECENNIREMIQQRQNKDTSG
ncbi:Prefoldin subunit 1 [Melipona quadrifasciata]|uniref:Prefoldin subunit 1 n=1 Tax=Melipona quadrifasciata TaxID=166423 RepID=A0A0M9A7R4_9HYME|nr:Prefoldin subunit 1 [Melipona quadrifasciata]